jgi:hypothetical protein
MQTSKSVQTCVIIIQSIAMKTCVMFNIIVKKIKLKHPNLTQGRSQPLVAERAADFHGRAKKFKRKG